MALELKVVEGRIRRAYELGRLRRAAIRSLPLGAIAASAIYFGPQRSFDFALGLSFVATAIFYLWQGQYAARALKPSVIAGLFPLLLSLIVNRTHPACGHESMLSACTIACALGGVIAATRIIRFSRTQKHPSTAYGLALIPTVLLGSLGCGCIGFTGVLAMSIAIIVVSIPTMFVWVFSR
jgi:hypothetical protein